MCLCTKTLCADRSVEGVEDEKAPSSGAKSLCIPHDQARWGDIQGKTCPQCGKDAKRWTLFGRSCECVPLFTHTHTHTHTRPHALLLLLPLLLASAFCSSLESRVKGDRVLTTRC